MTDEDSIMLEELSISSRTRKEFYQLLSSIFEKEATSDLIIALRNNKNMFTTEPTDSIDNEKMREGLRLVKKYLDETSKKSLDEIQLQLAIEYAGLFLGVWGKPSHPSESIYGNVGGTIMQEERDQVLQLYRSMGLDRSKNFREPEDHIAIELQFMSILSGKTFDSAKAKNMQEVRRLLRMQESFLQKHLGKWIGFLSHDVQEQGKLDFYKGICILTDGMVHQDLEMLKDLNEELKNH